MTDAQPQALAAQPQAPAAQPQAPPPSSGQLTSPAPKTQRQKDPKRVAAGKAVAEKNKAGSRKAKKGFG